jgi:hypothetical protein
MSTPQCQEEQSEKRATAPRRRTAGEVGVKTPTPTPTPTRTPARSRKRFTPQEQESLERLRRAVQRGERSDAYPVDRRQDFVRWLIAQGRLSDK